MELPTTLAEWATVIGILGFPISGLIVWYVRSGMAKASDLESHKTDIKDVLEAQQKLINTIQGKTDGRLVKLEERLEHLPTTAEFTDMRVTLGKVETGMGGITRELDGARSSLTRIENFLLKQGADHG